jgi:two-component system, sporulation sensor kinase D
LFAILSGYNNKELLPFILKAVKSVNTRNTMKYWSYYDINQDQIDELIVIEKYDNNCQPITIRNQTFDQVYSQRNRPYPLRGYKVLYNDEDKSNWLYISYNDEKKVCLDAFKYDKQYNYFTKEIKYQPIPRTSYSIANPQGPWFGNITPVFINDIDGDGIAELVCLGADGFNSNPRGIFAFEVTTGKLKWRFDTAANIRDLIYEDYDLDGKKDLIFSTVVLKNNNFEINGITDHSSYLGVLDGHGQLLHLEKGYDGFGLIALGAQDLNNDGKNEIIRLDETWGTEVHPNTISIIYSNGKAFVTDEKYTFASGLTPYAKIIVSSLSEHGDKYIFLSDKENGLVILDSKLLMMKHNITETFKRIEAIDDLDNDGFKEILLLSDNNNYVALNHHFRQTAEIANPYKDDDHSQAFIIQTGLDLPKRLALTSQNGLSYYNYKRSITWLTYFIKILRPYAIYSTIVLLLTTILLGLLLRNSRKYFRIVKEHGGVALLISTKRKIILINECASEFLHTYPKVKYHPHINLSSSQTDFTRELSTFIRSKTDSAYKQVCFQESPQGCRQVFFYRMKKLPLRVLIVISLSENISDAREKIEWAGVARKLSHHVRRHITNILLALDAIEHCPDLQDQVEKRELIKSEVDKIKSFTQSFQRFTEMGKIALTKADLVPHLENCLNRIVIPSNIKMIKDWTLMSVDVLMESVRFEEVITNLVTNAIDSMPDGGTLRISLIAKASPQGDNYAIIEVEDTGKGIPEKYLLDIWEPFFTTKQNGTGIGLPECKKTIEAMGGKIELISVEGVGTTVSILLKGCSI